jgi:hypothetical protein
MNWPLHVGFVAVFEACQPSKVPEPSANPERTDVEQDAASTVPTSLSSAAPTSAASIPPAPKPEPTQAWTAVPLAKRDPALKGLTLGDSCKQDTDCVVTTTTLEGPLVCCMPASCREVVVTNRVAAGVLQKRCEAHQMTRKPSPQGWTPCPPLDCMEAPKAKCVSSVCVLASP